MLDQIKKLGVGVLGVGVLGGIGLTIWVAPNTIGGQGLVFVVGLVVTVLVLEIACRMLRALRRSSPQEPQ